jgi:hypothetical protein
MLNINNLIMLKAMKKSKILIIRKTIIMN